MPEAQRYWFATCTRDEQELVIRKSLSRLKSEGHLDVDYYPPTRVVVSQLKYRCKCSEVPVTHSLVLIRVIKQTVRNLSNVYGVRFFYTKDLFTCFIPTVPDKQMPDFMFVMDLSSDGVSSDDGFLVVGDRMRVVRDDFTGIEGEVATNANRAHVVIRIKNTLTVSVKVPESYLKITK